MALTFAKAGASHLFLIDLSQQGLAETARQVAEAAPGCSTSLYAADLTASSISATLDRLVQVQPHTYILLCFEEIASEEYADHQQACLQDAESHIDVLINNAGVLDNSSVAESDPAKWWHVWEVNLRATYTVTHHLLPCMLAAQKATIICVSSMVPALLCSLLSGMLDGTAGSTATDADCMQACKGL